MNLLRNPCGIAPIRLARAERTEIAELPIFFMKFEQAAPMSSIMASRSSRVERLAPQLTPSAQPRRNQAAREDAATSRTQWGTSVDQCRNPAGYVEKQHHSAEEHGHTEGVDRHPGRGYGEGHCIQRRNGETGGEEDDGHPPPVFTQESQQPVRPGPEPGPNATGRLAECEPGADLANGLSVTPKHKPGRSETR
jgi:hypothetical protein